MKLSIKKQPPPPLPRASSQPPQPPIDRGKMYELGNKRLRGELLTPEEEKFLKDFMIHYQTDRAVRQGASSARIRRLIRSPTWAKARSG